MKTIGRRVSVAPMMDGIDNQTSSNGSSGYEPLKNPSLYVAQL